MNAAEEGAAVDLPTFKDQAADDRRQAVVQANWRFYHDGQGPLAQATPYEVRQFIKAALPGWPHLEASVRQSQLCLTVTSREHKATRWLIDHMGELLQVVSSFAGRMLRVDPQMLTPEFQLGGRFVYVIPRLIVQRADKKDVWARWLPQQLDQSVQQDLHALVTAGLASELRRWGLVAQDFTPLGLSVTDFGRSMPIVPGNGPRGLARLDVKFVAPWKVGADMFVGLHTHQGHGLVRRRGEIAPFAQAAGGDE